MTYTSSKNEKIKYLKSLHNKKYRDENSEFLIEGSILILDAFRAGYLKELFIEEDVLIPLPVTTSYISKEVSEKISYLKSNDNAFGLCKKKKEIEAIGSKVLFLDNVQDPGNIGTIIRSAMAFNIDTIILKDCCDLYNDKLIRSSKGAFFHVDIIETKNLDELIELKNKAYKIMGTKVTSGVNIKTLEKENKFVIIMGNEGTGVSEEILEMCDTNLYISMNESCESLNVAVATSIILYEIDKWV